MSKGHYFMNTLTKFVENLNYLISEREITGKKLAIELGITEASLTYYRKGINTPSVTNIIKFADYFHCSVDFLLGREDEHSDMVFNTCPPIAKRMAEMPALANMTIEVLCKKLDIAESSFYEWKNGSSEPNIYSIIKIADYLDCRVDFILGRES